MREKKRFHFFLFAYILTCMCVFFIYNYDLIKISCIYATEIWVKYYYNIE